MGIRCYPLVPAVDSDCSWSENFSLFQSSCPKYERLFALIRKLGSVCQGEFLKILLFHPKTLGPWSLLGNHRPAWPLLKLPFCTYPWRMNTNISRSTPTPREPEPGFERVILLTPSEIIDLMHLLDQPARSGSAFRLDPNGFVRRRTKGGPIIGKADTVEAAMRTIIQVGIAVLGHYPSKNHDQSNVAPIGDPQSQPESSPAPSDEVERIEEFERQGEIHVPASRGAASPVASTDNYGSCAAPPPRSTAESLVPNSAGSSFAPSDSEKPTGPMDSFSAGSTSNGIPLESPSRPTPPTKDGHSLSYRVGVLCLLVSFVITLAGCFYVYFCT
jgi:hypothetical protein